MLFGTQFAFRHSPNKSVSPAVTVLFQSPPARPPPAAHHARPLAHTLLPHSHASSVHHCQRPATPALRAPGALPVPWRPGGHCGCLAWGRAMSAGRRAAACPRPYQKEVFLSLRRLQQRPSEEGHGTISEAGTTGVCGWPEGIEIAAREDRVQCPRGQWGWQHEGAGARLLVTAVLSHTR